MVSRQGGRGNSLCEGPVVGNGLTGLRKCKAAQSGEETGMVA